MPMRIASLDFETANYADASICAAGVAVFEGDALTDLWYRLVRPPKGFGWFRDDFTEDCHGLTWFDVRDASEFPGIAPELLARLTSADIVIAHHAQFDMRKLAGILHHFGLECPAFDYLCTLRLSRRVWPDLPDHRLPTVAAHVAHEFQHHHAQADAEAAGWVLLGMMKAAGVETARTLAEAVGMECERFCGHPSEAE